MLTAVQIKLFAIFFAIGIAVGIVFGICKLINVFVRSKILQFVTDLMATLFGGIVYLILINKLNMGIMRLYLIVAFVLGIVLERLTLGKIFAKLYKKLYNVLEKLNTNFKQTKVGKFIFK